MTRAHALQVVHSTADAAHSPELDAWLQGVRKYKDTLKTLTTWHMERTIRVVNPRAVGQEILGSMVAQEESAKKALKRDLAEKLLDRAVKRHRDLAVKAVRVQVSPADYARRARRATARPAARVTHRVRRRATGAACAAASGSASWRTWGGGRSSQRGSGSSRVRCVWSFRHHHA